MPVSEIFVILPMLKGNKKTTDTEYLSFQLGVGFIVCGWHYLGVSQCLVENPVLSRTMSVLYFICNICCLNLLHNFNVFGVNTATIQNTILYFMGFKPLLGGVLIVVHIWAILGFQYKIRNKDFHLYYYLLGSVTCSHTTDFLERNTAIC